MKDGIARAILEELQRRQENLEEKAVVAYPCPKCARRTAHEHIYVRTFVDGTHREVPVGFSGCIGLHIEPGRRCLSCGTVYMLTGFAEVQLEK